MIQGKTFRRTRDARGLRLPGALLPVLLIIAAATGAGATLEPSAAIPAGATVPVLDHDVSRAHQQALGLSFRQAVITCLASLGAQPGSADRVLENPDRYVLAFRIREQTRRDLFYRLQLMVWLDQPLLQKEASGSRGNR